MAVKLNFKMAAGAILDFARYKFDSRKSCVTSFSVSPSNLAKIYAIVAELLRFRQKFKMAAVCHLGLLFGKLAHPRSLLDDRKRDFKFHVKSKVFESEA